MLVKEIIRSLNEIAPFETAESFDNVGLLIGSLKEEVRIWLRLRRSLSLYATQPGTGAVACVFPHLSAK